MLDSDISAFNESLFSFLQKSPTSFHAAAALKEILTARGFLELDECENWKLRQGKSYYVSRNGAIIAFTLSADEPLQSGFRMVGTHTDSPALQIKPNPKQAKSEYLVLGVEKYGGALLHSWFDRELSVAGRVSCRTDGNGTLIFLVDFSRPLLFIPSLAIHLNRSANEGQEANVQSHLSPILASHHEQKQLDFRRLLMEHLSNIHPTISIDAILGFDLFCYDPQAPSYFGANNEFIAAARLDNLLSCHCGVEALTKANARHNTMLICTNHEEVGSTSNSGALGNFPESIMERIIPDTQKRAICLRRSFLLSLDNAHATHPNYQEKSDADHEILLNRGPAIKINASQRYSSTAKSSALFRIIAEEAGVSTQDFVMRSDMPSGSTIGPLSSAKLGLDAVDVGAPTWAMHSIREATGAFDPHLLFRAVKHFYSRPQLPSFKEIL